jgi:hypothetical protein
MTQVEDLEAQVAQEEGRKRRRGDGGDDDLASASEGGCDPRLQQARPVVCVCGFV